MQPAGQIILTWLHEPVHLDADHHRPSSFFNSFRGILRVIFPGNNNIATRAGPENSGSGLPTTRGDRSGQHQKIPHNEL